ncbi:MAG: alpha/beta hydrolase [Thermoanaerobaculia bacterium]|nr:alpha/beta hydrolase [Thermoanaerobaculia bacterium]
MRRRALALCGSLALALACSGDGPRMMAKRTARPELATGSFTANVNGRQLHYEVRGSGPVLMTLPNSWGLTLDGLRALYRPLEKHLTMVYFDPRGMGGSGPVIDESDMSLKAVRDDFDALRRLLGLGRVNAIGWSNGATNLIFLASERPQILGSAIFVHGVSRASEDDFADFGERYPEWAAAAAELQRQMARDDLAADEKTRLLRTFNMESAFPSLFADPDRGRALLAEAWAGVGFSARHGAYAQAELGLFDLRDQIAAIPVRSLVIAGAFDVLPPERAREIADGVADGRFVLFENSGHFAPLEEPARFVQVVVDFLREG